MLHLLTQVVVLHAIERLLQAFLALKAGIRARIQLGVATDVLRVRMLVLRSTIVRLIVHVLVLLLFRERLILLLLVDWHVHMPCVHLRVVDQICRHLLLAVRLLLVKLLRRHHHH